MVMSKRARDKFNLLVEVSVAYVARHYSKELQSNYEIHVFDAAQAFVKQITDDDYEAAEGSYDNEEAPF